MSKKIYQLLGVNENSSRYYSGSIKFKNIICSEDSKRIESICKICNEYKDNLYSLNYNIYNVVRSELDKNIKINDTKSQRLERKIEGIENAISILNKYKSKCNKLQLTKLIKIKNDCINKKKNLETESNNIRNSITSLVNDEMKNIRKRNKDLLKNDPVSSRILKANKWCKEFTVNEVDVLE